MGSFDATCAYTRTAIRGGDEVLMVALSTGTYMRDSLLDTYNLLNYWHNYRRRKEEYKPPYRFIGLGVYNSYGTIEGFDNVIEDRVAGGWADYQFLVHRSVAEGLLGHQLTPGLPSESYEGVAFKLIEIAFQARIQLKGNHLVGEQHVDEDVILLQRKVLALASDVLDKHQKYLDQFKDDEDDENWHRDYLKDYED